MTVLIQRVISICRLLPIVLVIKTREREKERRDGTASGKELQVICAINATERTE